MCGGTLIARASRTRNSKLGFLLLLFSIAHLPLLRHADAKILQGELMTREVTAKDRIDFMKHKMESRVVSKGLRSMAPRGSCMINIIARRVRASFHLLLNKKLTEFY